MGSEISSDAQQLSSAASTRLHSEIDSRKGAAADQAKSVSSAIDKTAGNLGDNAPDWLKSALRQGADKVQQFADTLEHKDSREIFNDVRSFARDNPGTFLAGCAAAGFAAARVFKAGGDLPSRGSGKHSAPPQVDEPTMSSPRTAGSPSTASTPSSKGAFA
jgi:hypothetical protein